MRLLAFLVAPLVAVGALSSPAQAERVLTLDEALAIARLQSRDLRAARARLEQSAVGVQQAWAPLLPTLAAQGKYTRNYKEVTLPLVTQQQIDLQNAQAAFTRDLVTEVWINQGRPLPASVGQLNDLAAQSALPTTPQNIVIQPLDQLDLNITGTVPLVVPYAYEGLKAAKKGASAAEATYRVNEAAVLYGAAQAFFAAAGTDELVGARRHAVEVAKKTLDNARARLQAGVVNRVEVTRAELALVRAEQQHREALDAQAQAYRSLATVLNLHERFRVAPQPTVTDAGDPGELAKNALSLRPEWAANERTIEAAKATANAAAWRWAPTLAGFGLFRAFNYRGFFGDNYAWSVGLQLDWLIYDGGIRDAQRKLAWAQRREAEARLDLLRDTITDEIYNARRAVDTKRRALETAERSVKLARETLDLVRVQHDAGTATQLDLLQAQDALVGSEVALAQARFDLALSDLSLRRTAGTFPGR